MGSYTTQCQLQEQSITDPNIRIINYRPEQGETHIASPTRNRPPHQQSQ